MINKNIPKSILTLMAIILILNSIFLGCIEKEKDEKIVVIDSWGGMFQEAQRKAIFDPFTEETGIKVVELSDGENIFAKVKAQVEYDNPNIDVFHADASWLGRGKKDGILYPIDYEVIDKTDIYEDVIDPYGVGILYWSYNIVYNTDKFSDEHPTTWKEFWNWASSNGPCSFNGGRPNHGIEIALMAKGYSTNEIYPLTDEKIDEAFKFFENNKQNIIWYTEGGQGQQLLSDQEVMLGEFFGGDAFMLSEKGVPIAVEWNQGIYTSDYWLVPKNAPHKENAMKLIEFALRPEQQARFAELTYYGPVNKKAFDYIEDESTLENLPSNPKNKNKMLLFDWIWWGQHEDELLERWNIVISE